jgi:hypothetical protein
MKTIIITIATVFVASFANGQGIMAKWPQLKAFHGVMSQTFHPSEDGNLEPIKTRSAEMMAKADTLQKSKIPSEFDNKDVRAAISKLAIDSKKLHELILAKGTDIAIKKALSDLHDTFHLIVEKCSKNEEHH